MDLIPSRYVSCRDATITLPLNAFREKKVHALAGIGNPERFFKTLESDLNVTVERHPLPDHVSFSESDITFADSYPVIMTEKDAVKVKEFANDQHWYLEVWARLPDNFMSQLNQKLEHIKELKGIKKNG